MNFLKMPTKDFVVVGDEGGWLCEGGGWFCEGDEGAWGLSPLIVGSYADPRET